MSERLPPLTLPDEGHTYGYDLLGHRFCTGARMGLPVYMPADPAAPVKLRLVKMRMVDRDYAPNGAYFGNVAGSPLYHAESVAEVPVTWNGQPHEGNRTVRLFERGATRREVKELILTKLPNATFYR